MSEIGPGDTVKDTTDGSTLIVTDDTEQSAAEWSDEKGYDVVRENYGNSRAGASDDDRMFECVYANDVQSEPTKPYDFPESRLRRVEHEKATGVRVQDVIRERFFARLLQAVPADAAHPDLPTRDQLELLATEAGVSDDVIEMAVSRAELDAAETEDEDDRDPEQAVKEVYAASEADDAVGDGRPEPSTEDDDELGAFDPDGGSF